MDCKICGFEARYIGLHLRLIHKISDKEYLLQFPDAKLYDDDYLKTRIEIRKETIKKVREKFYSNTENVTQWKEKIKKTCNTPEYIEKMRINNSGKKNPMYGKKQWNKGLTKETDKRILKNVIACSKPRSERGCKNIQLASQKRTKENKQWYENVCKNNRLMAQKRKGIPRPPEVMKKILCVNKPTDIERQFIELIKKHNLPYRYVGNGDLWISNMNPDFININGKKQVVEVNGDFWHKGQNSQDRINRFKKYGFDCVVIWGKEMKGQDWESRVLSKLIE